MAHASAINGDGKRHWTAVARWEARALEAAGSLGLGLHEMRSLDNHIDPVWFARANTQSATKRPQPRSLAISWKSPRDCYLHSAFIALRQPEWRRPRVKCQPDIWPKRLSCTCSPNKPTIARAPTSLTPILSTKLEACQRIDECRSLEQLVGSYSICISAQS